jgi:hypothetical protein
MLRMKKWLILTAATTAALGALSASSASGAFSLLSEIKCEGGTTIAFCWSKEATGPLFELSGEEQFEGSRETGTTVSVRFKLFEEGFEILCGGATGKGTIAQPESLVKNYSTANTINLTECKLDGLIGEKCKVPSTLETKQLTGTPLNAESIDFKAKEGEVLMEFALEELKGCPATIKGIKLKVKGQQLCEWQEPGVDQTSKLLICDPKSELSSQFAKLELELTLEVKLINISPDFWDIVEVS